MATTDKSPSSELPEPSVGDSLSPITSKTAGIDLNNSKDVSTCSDLNSSSDHSDYESFEYDLGQLSNLPPEIVHCILGYLDARFVLTRLSLVCKTFYHLLKDTTTWRLRVVKLSEKSYPVFPGKRLGKIHLLLGRFYFFGEYYGQYGLRINTVKRPHPKIG